MIRRPIGRPTYIALGLICILILSIGYSYISWRQHQFNPLDKTIPTWLQLKDGFFKVFTPHETSGEIWIWEDFKATFFRLFSGLAVGVLGGVILGVLMGCYTPVEAFFLPPLAFLSKIPPTAVLAVFFVMVGTGYQMFIGMIAFGILPTLAQSIFEAAKKDVPDELIHKSLTLGATQPELIYNVIFKHILPRMLEAIRLQIGPSMVYLLAAEMMVADVGFGYRIRLQSRLLDMRVVYVYLIFLGLAGYTMDHAFIYIRRKLCPWYAP